MIVLAVHNREVHAGSAFELALDRFSDPPLLAAGLKLMLLLAKMATYPRWLLTTESQSRIFQDCKDLRTDS